jgi:tRNA A-37 threonylcarbamoyl transferase component Bud32
MSPQGSDDRTTLPVVPPALGATLPLGTPATPAAVREAVPGYEVLGELGRGGMGVVLKARQVKVNRLVALKMILAGDLAGDRDRQRFQTEAAAIARLQHPNIVQVYEVGEHDGLPFFSLEFCPGGSLDRKLEGTPLPPAEAAVLVEKLARAMHFAHQKGVVHRDLKPGNVLLAEDGAPKIADFGLARQLDGAGQTSTGQVLGTPSYMAPEQAVGEGKTAGPAADVYALGAILYECLTGRPPFRAATSLDTLLQVVKQEPVAVRQLQPKTPPDLDTICRKCLEKDPGRRYASAADLADDLARFLRHEPIRARPLGTTERLGRWCRRRPGAAAALVLALLVVVAALAAWYAFTRRLGRELQRTEQARAAAAAAEERLQESLTRQAAERLDADLRQLTALPQSLALALERLDRWQDAPLEAWMRAALEGDERLFGLCAAFEPQQFDPARADFALYVYRAPEGIRAKQLLPPAYPPYRGCDWYRRPHDQGRPLWSEPYVDVGGGDVPMLTFSVPLRRGGRFAGVLTIDLSLTYFRRLRQLLGELTPEEERYAFLLSPAGTFLSHEEDAFRMPETFAAVAEAGGDPRLLELAGALRQGNPGHATAPDLVTGRPALYHYAPVRSAGWMLVIVTPARPS